MAGSSQLVKELRFFFKDVCGLPLGADKEDRFARSHGIPDEGIGLLHPREGLLQIDDVDTIALAEEKFLHLRIPAVGLVSEVHSGFQ